MADNTTFTPGTGATIAADDVGGVLYQRVKLTVGADGAATDISSAAPLPDNIIQVGSTAVNAFPAGFQRTTDEPRQVFYDPFDAALDVTNRWAATTSAGGGVAASVTSGVMTLGSGTTTNGYSYLTSRPSITPTVPAWLGNSWAISIESAVGTNAVRFWGMGIVSGSVPTSTTPLGTTGNGYGFELDIAGVLQAVVYSNGTRTAVASLAAFQPADALYHRYICFYRTDRIYWYVDGLASTQLAATSNFQSPIVQTLPVLALSVAHSVAPAASRVITTTGLAVWDTGKNHTSNADGLYPWRKQTVKDASTAAVATDMAAVVALHPTSPLPTGTNSVGSVVQGTAAATAAAWPVKLTDGTNISTVKAASTAAAAADPAQVVSLSPNSPLPAGSNIVGAVLPATLVGTTVSAANTTVTLTLAAVASQFHYISRIVIERVATTAITGTALLTYTSTNLPGTWARTTGNAALVGIQYKDVDEQLGAELKSSVANTATTIIAPAAGAAGFIRITVYYRTGT